MRAFLVACLAIIVIGGGSYYLLNTAQQPAGIAFTTDGTRIDPSWSWRVNASDKPCEPRRSWQWIFVDFGDPHGESKICSISQ